MGVLEAMNETNETKEMDPVDRLGCSTYENEEAMSQLRVDAC